MSEFTSWATKMMFRFSSPSTASAPSGLEKGGLKQFAIVVGASLREMNSESPNSNWSAASLTNSPLR